MTREKFFIMIQEIYRVGNRADHDARHKYGEEWTKAEMAGTACCAKLDEMLQELYKVGVLTGEEHQDFYDSL